MKNILYLVSVDSFVPFFWHVSRHLEARGYRPFFATFLPREHAWLRKCGVRLVPEDAYAVRDCELDMNLFSAQELDSILSFALAKKGAHRRHWQERVLRAAAVLDEVLEECGIDVVVVWNGQEAISKALSLLARRKGIDVVYGENGYFPNTLQIDLQGVNLDASIATMAFDDVRRRLGEHGPEEGHSSGKPYEVGGMPQLTGLDYLRSFAKRKLTFAYYRHFPEHRASSWFKTKVLGLRRSFIAPDKILLPHKFIFIPFQVHDDTQILLNSKWFKSMEEFFEFSYLAIKRNFGDEYAIVVKEHPEDLCRHSYGDLKDRYPDVVWLRKYDIDVLLDAASYVFVINSSVGLQAVQRRRPTIVFGESFYTRDEVAFPVRDLSRVDEVIDRAKSGITPERERNIELFMRFLRERYFVSASWKRLSAGAVENVASKIESLVR